MTIKNYLEHHPLHKILYPMMVPAMALSMIMPIGLSSISPIVANAKRRPRVTRRVRKPRRRSSRFYVRQLHLKRHKSHKVRKSHEGLRLIYAGYQKNNKKARKHGAGLGHYVIRIAFMRNGALKGASSNDIKRNWGDTANNRKILQKKVNHRNKQLRGKKAAPADASYLVAKDQQLADGTQSTNIGAKKNNHKGIVPVKLRSRTTLWDLARANLRHYNRRTAKRTVNNMAKTLLKLNPKIKNIHKYIRKGTILGVPTKQAKRFKTSFSAWAEFAAGLNKAEQRAKRWIARAESTDNYYVWQGHHRRSGYKVPYGKYQLEHGYLHTVNGHKWNSPYTQEDIANQYAYGRYGNWQKAKKFHLSHGWY